MAVRFSRRLRHDTETTNRSFATRGQDWHRESRSTQAAILAATALYMKRTNPAPNMLAIGTGVRLSALRRFWETARPA